VLLQSTAWCIPHLGFSCVDHNSSRIGSIAHNSNHGNLSSNSRRNSNSSSSIVPLHRRHSRLPSGHHSSFPASNFPCFNCRKMDHFARECHLPKQSNSPRALAPVVNQQRGHQKGPAPRVARANYTTVEEIPTGEDMLTEGDAIYGGYESTICD
jgi:hypothetical protein